MADRKTCKCGACFGVGLFDDGRQEIPCPACGAEGVTHLSPAEALAVAKAAYAA